MKFSPVSRISIFSINNFLKHQQLSDTIANTQEWIKDKTQGKKMALWSFFNGCFGPLQNVSMVQGVALFLR